MKSPATNYLRCLCCALIAVCVLVAGSKFVQAQQNWLVLENGQTLTGQVVLGGDSYSVLTDNGSRIVIHKSQVRFVAESIRDVYWDKWSRVDPNDPSSHTKLFRWCLKHELLHEAQQQIELVAKLDSMDDQSSHLLRMASELELVVNRKQKEAELALKQEIEQLNIRNLPPLPGSPTQAETAELAGSLLASAPKIPSISLDAEGRPARRLNSNPQALQQKPDVVLVDFEEDLSATPKPTRREKPAWISTRQLDREVRLMPKDTVSFYKRQIEPHLISNCVSCHDVRSQDMPLSKRAFGQTIPRRMSQQNLYFVMQQVDRENPFDSPLHAMATTAHGGQEKASFAHGDPVLFSLRQWTVAVSDDPARWLMQLASESHQPTVKVVIPEAPPQVEEATEIVEELPKVIEQQSADPYDPNAFNLNADPPK